LIHLSKFEEALDITNKVLAKNPEHMDALTIKSSALYQLKQFEEALDIANKVLD